MMIQKCFIWQNKYSKLLLLQELNREEEDKSSKFDPLNILAGRLIEVKHSMNENFDEDDLLGEQEK